LAIEAGTPDSAVPGQDEARWESRRFAAWSLRAGIVLAPVIVAVVVMAVVSRLVTRPHAGAGLLLWLGWWALVFASSIVALWVTDRAARRLTPLAALLDLAVLFPGRAPTRFAIARKAGDLRSLKNLTEKGSPRERDDLATAAEQILALVGSLRAHDRHTRGHSERVRVYTDMIAEELRLPAAAVDRLRWASLLHDIGKLWIPASVLNKPGKLTKSEWEAVRQHPDHGAALAADLLPWLGPWGLAIAEHHEHFDGTGYPRGLSGANISLAGRIVGVADSFETMTATRPYKKARTRAAALEELVRFSNKQFDPDVVRALLAVSAPKLAWAMGPASWLTGLPFIGSAPSVTGAGLAAQAATGVAGVAVASVAGVAVAAVPSYPSPTPVAHSATTTVAAGAPAGAPAGSAGSAGGSAGSAGRSAPRSRSGSPGAGRGSASPTQTTPTPGPLVGPQVATSSSTATSTSTAAPAAVTPSAAGAAAAQAAGATASSKATPTSTSRSTATHPPSATTPSATRTAQATPTATAAATPTTTPTPTATPRPTPSPTVTVAPAPTPAPTPTVAPPAVTSVQVNYADLNVLPLVTQLMPQIAVVNTGTASVDLSGITVRYYFTEDSNGALNSSCTYAAIGCGAISATFGSTGGQNADHYLQLQLSGTLAPGASTGPIQERIGKSDLTLFNQMNDYSYGSSLLAQASTHVTAYHNGQLIWGVEP
jgi:HD domain-containing protein/cellulose binding protein with CBM3 domain